MPHDAAAFILSYGRLMHRESINAGCPTVPSGRHTVPPLSTHHLVDSAEYNAVFGSHMAREAEAEEAEVVRNFHAERMAQRGRHSPTV